MHEVRCFTAGYMGTIPSSLGNLTKNLVDLELQKNALSGSSISASIPGQHQDIALSRMLFSVSSLKMLI
jgi:hypothetical protein